MPKFTLEDAVASDEMLAYLSSIVLVHRTFALVDVPFEKVLSGKVEDPFYAREVLAHLAQLQAALIESDGLNYVPRDRTQDGRFSDVALADTGAFLIHAATAQRAPQGNSFSASMIVDGGTGTFNDSSYLPSGDLNASLRDQLRQ